MGRLSAVLLIALFVAGSLAGEDARAEVATKVYLNGVPAPVFFNDGDSFRVLGGTLVGMKARLAGFNTLESHGSVHRWGGWSPKELYWNAKMATLNARRGIWHCESKDMAKDVYGRVLFYCKDLVISQLRKGYAHAMTVTHEPSPPEYLAAQRDAIKHRRGMWAHGVPHYILTSIHSMDEGYGKKAGKTYNRVVSTHDGHSAKWRHAETYGLCHWACRSEIKVPDHVIDRAAAALAKMSELVALARRWGKARFWQLAADYGRLGYVTGIKDQKIHALVLAKLADLKSQGVFGDYPTDKGSCVLYVPFKQRFGRARAKCLDQK